MEVKSLCHCCRHVRKITSGTGSQFLLCRLAATNAAYRKYPPQPVVRCTGYSDVERDGADPPSDDGQVP